LYAAIARTYQLGVSLPDAPLQAFRQASAGLPRTTETERLTVERIGQDIFRKSLLAYWNNRCPMTGVAEYDVWKVRGARDAGGAIFSETAGASGFRDCR